MRRIVITFITILLTLLLITGCGNTKKEDIKEDVKINTNKDVIKDQEVDGIKMTNTSLVTTNGISKLVTSVTNNSDKDYKLEQYTIIIKDKDGQVIVKIPGYVGDTIKAGETKTINSSIDKDLSNAASIEYSIVK